MALTRVPMPSPNYSGRGGAGVRLVVLHTAEGATTIESLGSYFASPSAGVSSHVGIDDKANTVGEYVRVDGKAWTQGDANPVAVSAELCAFASWSRSEWDRHPAMLLNAARWVAEECARFGLPIRSLSAGEAQGGAAGVCDHVDLGAWGGGHWDCGDGFPMEDVLRVARGEAPPAAAEPIKPRVIRGKDGDDVTSLQDETFTHVWGEVDGRPCHWWQFLPGKGDNPVGESWFFEWMPRGG
jgi:N-acetylmuramoyl-L-alanine amidase